jgi:formate dehydrogenase iron-sulfur subunit
MAHQHSFHGPLADPAGDAGYQEHRPRVGFFTDTSICIGCKACEVACKEWNNVPEDGLNLLGMSFDNTGMLGADSWRHVAFIEQNRPLGQQDAGLHDLPTGPSVTQEAAAVVAEALPQTERSGGDLGTAPVDLGFPSFELPGRTPGEHPRAEFRWLMASDVCKHCTHAGCLDVCPTGALFRTEFGTVVLRPAAR